MAKDMFKVLVNRTNINLYTYVNLIQQKVGKLSFDTRVDHYYMFNLNSIIIVLMKNDSEQTRSIRS